MKRIKIRTKIMLWYTLLTSILLIIFIPLLYSSISNSLFSNAESVLRSNISLAETGIEYEDNVLSWDENVVVPNDKPTFITNMKNQVIYSNSQRNQLKALSFQEGILRSAEVDGQRWLIMDEAISKEGVTIAHIRIFNPLEEVDHTLNRVKVIMILSIPTYLLITIAGGLLIAKKALQPIDHIIKIAKSIGRGDLSSRITGVGSHDEVGELSETFNEMLEKLEESFHKEKRFAADASHELRTPVSIIMAYSENMLNDLKISPSTEDLEKHLLIIKKESERMSTIISQLLTLTRGYEGRYKLIKERIDITEVIVNVIGELEEAAEERKIKLLYHYNGPAYIEADQSLLTQMMLNLVENAIKYGINDGTVCVATEQTEDKIIITVEDDGIGIAQEQIKHIFERFYRADQSRDRSGTGLGLSIVKWIIDEHGGDIGVSSLLGKGTRLEVQLPLNITVGG